ncbi:spore gernimation protein GerA [Aneurinibacillus sp. XH2]|uniref:spore germination protein n=1 Tax=Aneurinibacillus sp. XH2 TaxID=1450761 RepID=UPI00070AB7BD|nr:spore germination protein [Aneurinibacillus sp. XH2]AMA72991.1 spore gernimation protein GerA [Aneurinibacillus sp. XH2]
MTSSLQRNLQVVREQIGHSPDVIFRQFSFCGTLWKSAIVYIDGLVDKTALHEQIMKPLMQEPTAAEKAKQLSDGAAHIKNWVINSGIPIAEIKEAHNLNDCILEVLSGNALLFIDGIDSGFILGITGWEGRSIDEPVTESLVRGPRDGFVETLRNNTAMLRRRIKDPNFTMVVYKVGQRAKKDLAIVYIKGIANEELVAEVKRRVERINIDDVPESGYVEQLIEDNYLSPFPQVQNTERPDRVMSALMEGRVALLLDGTPFALIVPVTFSMLMSSPEDYYERWLPGSLIRAMRYGATFTALFLPALYISLISYNQGLIPTKLAISIAATREGVPFPSLIEALMMEVIIEILREAGVRLPKPVGQAVGIVGGLVIGQAAVEAGIVSPIMVIVVALTAISSFAFPQYGAGIAIRMLRFGMMMSAAVLGLYGVILFFILINAHLVKLKSFGVHYTASFTPYRPKDWKDMVIRAPLMMMKQRPEMNKTQDRKRQ